MLDSSATAQSVITVHFMKMAQQSAPPSIESFRSTEKCIQCPNCSADLFRMRHLCFKDDPMLLRIIEAYMDKTIRYVRIAVPDKPHISEHIDFVQPNLRYDNNAQWAGIDISTTVAPCKWEIKHCEDRSCKWPTHDRNNPAYAAEIERVAEARKRCQPEHRNLTPTSYEDCCFVCRNGLVGLGSCTCGAMGRFPKPQALCADLRVPGSMMSHLVEAARAQAGTRRRRLPRKKRGNAESFSQRLVPISHKTSLRKLPEYIQNPPVYRTIRWTVVGTGSGQSPTFLTFTNIDSGAYNVSVARYSSVRLLNLKVYFQVAADSPTGTNLCFVEYQEPNVVGSISNILGVEAYPTTGVEVACIHIKPSMSMLSATWAAVSGTTICTVTAPTNVTISVDATLAYM